MKKIILSASVIAAVAAVVIGATTAFFNDTEISRDNVFAAGSIDLGIDNESFYNGKFNQGTSWQLDFDLDVDPTDEEDEPRLFFNFDDLKPGDYGEDTISLHVRDNESWLCADVHLTSNDDVDCTEPELDVEGANCENDLPAPNADGDLAQNLNFIWWADDGDNVLEDDERPLPGGPLGNLNVSSTATVTLADASFNIWTGSSSDPFPAGDTRYIGKAWCFGDIAPAPLSQDSYDGPDDDNDGNGAAGEPEDGGITCSGINPGNEAQTDRATVDVRFRAEQSRHNADFQCAYQAQPEPATLTLLKDVIEENDSDSADTDWTLSASGPTPISGVEGDASITNAVVTPGSYDLSESAVAGFQQSGDWVCVGGTQNDGDTVTIAAGQSVTCTVTNTNI